MEAPRANPGDKIELVAINAASSYGAIWPYGSPTTTRNSPSVCVNTSSTDCIIAETGNVPPKVLQDHQLIRCNHLQRCELVPSPPPPSTQGVAGQTQSMIGAWPTKELVHCGAERTYEFSAKNHQYESPQNYC